MKIVVFGGTGNVGREVVAEAVKRGHEVTSVSRRGKESPGATAAKGDLGDTDRVVELVNANDVAVFAVPSDRSGGSAQPVIDAHRAIIAAKPTARLVVVGGAGSLNAPDGSGLLKDSEGFPAEYKSETEAFTQILQDYRASQAVDWTLVSPSPVIAEGERKGYVTAGDDIAGEFVSFTDFGDAIVDEIEKPDHKGSRFTVASTS